MYSFTYNLHCLCFIFLAANAAIFIRSDCQWHITGCPRSVRSWMDSNLLKLNPDHKTEFLLFRTRVRRNKLSNFFPTLMFGENVQPSNIAKNLGRGGQIDRPVAHGEWITELAFESFPIITRMGNLTLISSNDYRGVVVLGLWPTI